MGNKLVSEALNLGFRVVVMVRFLTGPWDGRPQNNNDVSMGTETVPVPASAKAE